MTALDREVLLVLDNCEHVIVPVAALARTLLAECPAQRLAQVGEQQPLRRAHARYHLELAQRSDPHLRRSEQLDWLARLSAEHDNLMAALRWAVRDDRETALRMIAATGSPQWFVGIVGCWRDFVTDRGRTNHLQPHRKYLQAVGRP
ncbi:hypothetical protein FRAHR75_1170004 [Frankia sp. Hr75.2]|nr:hypothetical protein FRAHR75_1170004 [Frankia sp. Hr75.2]